MANRVTVNICGEDYTLVAEESTAYMEQVAALVDKKMGEVIAGAKVGRSDAAVLAAVNLADAQERAGGGESAPPGEGISGRGRPGQGRDLRPEAPAL